jgi:hypothetical protein
METILGLIIGIGLSAACGFRVFVPLLGLSLAALTGHLDLSPGFEWIGSWVAFLAFATATVLEIGAYSIPWFDHLMDTLDDTCCRRRRNDHDRFTGNKPVPFSEVDTGPHCRGRCGRPHPDRDCPAEGRLLSRYRRAWKSSGLNGGGSRIPHHHCPCPASTRYGINRGGYVLCLDPIQMEKNETQTYPTLTISLPFC